MDERDSSTGERESCGGECAHTHTHTEGSLSNDDEDDDGTRRRRDSQVRAANSTFTPAV